MRKIIRRGHHLPLLSLLVIGLLIGPAVTSGYVWCLTADGHGTLEAAIAGECAADSRAGDAERIAGASLSADDDSCGPCLDLSTSHHWGNCRPRRDELPVGLFVNIAPSAVVATVPVPESNLNSHRVVDRSPRISEAILHHRTTVLLI